MQEFNRLVIVGAGPSGCAAAVQCTRLGEKPLLIDQTGRCGGLIRDAFLVENYPCMEPLKGIYVADLLDEFIARFNVSLLHSTVTEISSKKGGLFIRGSFGTMSARCVLIATGTLPKRFEHHDIEHLDGVIHYSLDSLNVAIPNPEHVIVIGGGEAALDYALSADAAGIRVTILVRSARLRATGRLVDLVHDRPGITIKMGHRIERIRKSKSEIALTVTDGSDHMIMYADGIISAIGRYPAAQDLLRGYENISTASGMALPRGLFVIGDARHGTLGQMGMAVGDGIAAASEAVAMLADEV